jgi:hypothetical protein
LSITIITTQYGRPEYHRARYHEYWSNSVPDPPIQQVADYSIDVYDLAGIKVGQFSSMIMLGYMSVTFTLNESGCGDFKLTLLRTPPFFIGRGFKIKINIFSSTTPYFCGFIMDIPQLGNTNLEKVYSGSGYFVQLDTCIIENKIYTSQKVEAIVTDLVQNVITGKTNIIYNAGKIDITSYTVLNQEFHYVTAKEALSQLVRLAGDWVYGVDELQEFFFHARNSTINISAVKSVGKHIEKFEPKEDASKIINRIYILSGQTTNGSNYITTVNDTTSQGIYGLREAIMTLPSALTAADADQWGNEQLAQLAYPIISAKLAGIDLKLLKEKITCVGQSRILLGIQDE